MTLTRTDPNVMFIRKALHMGRLSEDQAHRCLALLREDAEQGRVRGAQRLVLELGLMLEEQAEAVELALAQKTQAETRIPGYQFVRKLGEGAMGTVWLCRQLSMDRLVAVKILQPKFARSPGFKERFFREARASAKLSHENVVSGIDVGEADGRTYFVMEYVDGGTLRDLLERGGALDGERALRIVRQVAKALVHARRHFLVHRDIKPDNIMVNEDGVAKLLDLGLACIGQDAERDHLGKIVGTPNYMAPEQAGGETALDCRSDLYSLGATLYHLLTGQTPFKGTPELVMIGHLKDAPAHPWAINPEISEEAVLICEQLMAKKPDHRFQTPEDLVAAIDQVLAGKDLDLDPVITFQDPPEGLFDEDEDDAPESDSQSGLDRRKLQAARQRRRKRRPGSPRRATSVRRRRR